MRLGPHTTSSVSLSQGPSQLITVGISQGKVRYQPAVSFSIQEHISDPLEVWWKVWLQVRGKHPSKLGLVEGTDCQYNPPKKSSEEVIFPSLSLPFNVSDTGEECKNYLPFLILTQLFNLDYLSIIFQSNLPFHHPMTKYCIGCIFRISHFYI